MKNETEVQSVKLITAGVSSSDKNSAHSRRLVLVATAEEHRPDEDSVMHN
jgi:hypothetical protein